MESNYALYIREREGKEILEDELGFATYVFLPEHCYIEDIFVRQEYRSSGHASRYADAIAEIAKERGYKKLLGSVCPTAKGSDTSLKVLQAYGFKLSSSDRNMIYLEKEI
jgi:GNAT superfamily N-acetyltransferase